MVIFKIYDVIDSEQITAIHISSNISRQEVKATKL